MPGLEGKITHALQHTVRFFREVVPGDRLDIHAQLVSWKRGIAKGTALCSVAGNKVSSATMVITIPEIFTSFLPR